MIVWENVVYLVDDEKRDRAFDLLTGQVGLSPEAILHASDDELMPIVSIGILPEQRIEKLRQCAEIAKTRFSGDLNSIRALPLPKARRELQKFPRIGAPGAEKILLLRAASYPGARIEWPAGAASPRLWRAFGALRCLLPTRLASCAGKDLPSEKAHLERVHVLLRVHGERICRRNAPHCDTCPRHLICPSSGNKERWAIPWKLPCALTHYAHDDVVKGKSTMDSPTYEVFAVTMPSAMRDERSTSHCGDPMMPRCPWNYFVWLIRNDDGPSYWT